MILGRRIGILGGSFDPPHLGHLHVGRMCCKLLNLDMILYLCARENPFKHEHAVSWRHRLSMLLLMLRDEKQLFVSLFDLLSSGPSYAYKSLQAIQSCYAPAEKPIYLIGDDAALHFRQWKRYQEIVKRANIVVIQREGIRHSYAFTHKTLAIDALAISSTSLRLRLLRGEDCTGLLHEAVQGYIFRNTLYRQSI